MTKLLSTIFLLASVCIGLHAQAIEWAFVNLPEQYFPLLTKERRAELIFQHNMSGADSILNNFGGISRLREIDIANEYLKIDLTKKSTFELKALSTNDSNLVFVFSHTVCAPVCDSHLAFFDSEFRRLDTDVNPIFPDITVSDFLDTDKIRAAGETLENIVKKYDILFASICLQKDNTILIQSNTKEFLPTEIYEEILPYIIGDKILLTWNNGIFTKGQAKW